MNVKQIGILHPGNMGISVAASAINSGLIVHWASENRSPATRERATQFHLVDEGTLTRLCHQAEILISVCPPHAAEDLSADVIASGFQGIFVDANAIAPMRAERIGAHMAAAGIAFVDGGIIGGPAWDPGETWLYLAGEKAQEVAACFAVGPLETEVIGSEIGSASALKMCYAAYTKGSTALLSAILAAAEGLGVRAALYKQWDREPGDLHGQADRRARRVTAKAWRFAGEMEEISATFQHAGLPPEFHLAAAEVYRRIAHFKDADPLPDLDEVLAALRNSPSESDQSG